MKAGLLDRRVIVQRKVPTGRDRLHATTFELQNIRTLWAAKVPKSEDEHFGSEAKQRYSQRVVTFRTRYTADLVETDVLSCEGVSYEITGIRELGRREGLEITAEALS